MLKGDVNLPTDHCVYVLVCLSSDVDSIVGDWCCNTHRQQLYSKWRCADMVHLMYCATWAYIIGEKQRIKVVDVNAVFGHTCMWLIAACVVYRQSASGHYQTMSLFVAGLNKYLITAWAVLFMWLCCNANLYSVVLKWCQLDIRITWWKWKTPSFVLAGHILSIVCCVLCLVWYTFIFQQ